MTRRKVYDPVVPLFLTGATISEGVKRRGGKLFRISVVRTTSHQYLIKYTCRAKDANNRGPWRVVAEGMKILPESPEESGQNV